MVLAGLVSAGLSVHEHPARAAEPPRAPVTVIAVAAAGEAQETVFTLTMTRGVTAEVFTLPSPYRVIIDLPDAAFKLPPGTGTQERGLIKVFRYGLFAENKARVVIDTTGPVKVVSAAMANVSGRHDVELKIVLAPTDDAAFAAAAGRSKPEANDVANVPPAPPPALKNKKSRPVVVIDAGHGGIDPGATGANNLTEKAIVFAVAKQLEGIITKGGRYDVKLTRTQDVFVSLAKRLKLSAEFGADLFISLHADSIAETAFAENIRGATVYTLSERATDEQARRMAEKENASDLIAGLEGVDDSGNDQVKTILFDLMRRETSNFSADFSSLLVSRLSKNIVMSRDPRRSAAFKVLKQAHAPSVLVELGYMSNSKDQSEMTTTAWQLKVATSIAAAADSYFNKRTAVHP